MQAASVHSFGVGGTACATVQRTAAQVRLLGVTSMAVGLQLQQA